MKKSLYWAYVDLNEKIHIKRYLGDRHVRNAEESGTTIGIFEPFYAKDIKEAAHMILEKYREVVYVEKKVIT
jgi:hypothetical protein